ncbi:phage baseplate protein [Arsenophonus endosymbiont of Crataerina pallida]|uniref:phage baseplate protein n=1 Tax=Arsenophonus endosymbiont of Crataerina pallida TaxID=3066235 RepID=UPI0030D3C38D
MDILSTLFSQRSRKIGLLVPDVIISEKHHDTLEITEHPVELGAEIADHAYKRPAEVTMEVGFSSGGSLLDFWDTAKVAIRAGLSAPEIYQQILALQASRQPFDVITGKRKYKNMRIRAIEVTTDKHTETVLMAILTLRELNITQTQTVNIKSTDAKNMREGNTTSGVSNTGMKTPKPVDNRSLLQRGAAFFNGN